MDKKVLKEIGLTDYESEIYLTLLQYGSLSAYDLAQKTGMYRQATYDALNRLVEKGYVNSIKEGKSQKYKSVRPEMISEYLDEKAESFKHILPELSGLDKKSNDVLMVETYKGKNVSRVALRDIINRLKHSKNRLVLCTAIDESVPLSNYNTICEQYERDMLKYRIRERVIIKEGTRGIFQKGSSNYRKIEEKYFNPNPVQIYGDNVQIIVWGNPDHLIIIRSKEVADSYRKQFELLWKMAKKR
ncbi:winged helix-turn-helix transcriptional regulator [Candidatus Pacearchaeota archaeon]|nr:winged helix-turn-helix transcriptional regulator [Candidatus Pacearchaeota archaeon]